MSEQSEFFRLNEAYLKELREYLAKERMLRQQHQSRIAAILAEMHRIAKREPPE